MRSYYKTTRLTALFLALMWPVATTASPPACHRKDIDMFIYSDAVVEAVVVKSRRWSQGSTLHLVAKYRVVGVLKGEVQKAQILIVTDTCLDEPIPRHRQGYPVVETYCRGGIGLTLTGVKPKDGLPRMESEQKPNWILYLKKDIRRGAPQQTWLEVSRTGFGGGCWRSVDDLSPDQKEQFDRLQQRQKQLGLTGGPANAPAELSAMGNACGNGDGAACTAIGDRYKEGIGLTQDYHQAALFYKKGCDVGNALGCSQLGLLYAEGDGVLQDHHRSAELCRIGCRGGGAMGCTCLAYMYLYGRGGLKQDGFLAAELYHAGCKGGDAAGCYHLGEMYLGSHGIPADHKKARQFYTQSCVLGYQWGCDALKGF